MTRLGTLIVSALLFSGTLSATAAERPPNIVLIMADDLGYSDIGCFGGEIRTPNLDRMGDRGVRFSNFYNNAGCVPTRASLLTRLYPRQVPATGPGGKVGLV